MKSFRIHWQRNLRWDRCANLLVVTRVTGELRYEKPRLAQTWTADDLLALRNYVEESLEPDPQYIVTTTAFDRIRERVAPASKPPASLDRAILTRRPR